MTELYPSDADLAALSGATDPEQEVLFIPVGESPYHVSFYKMLHRLLDVARRAGDLRVYKDGALAFGVRAGSFMDDRTVRTVAASAGNALTNNATNRIYLTAGGSLTVNTTGFPDPRTAPHVRLATIVTSGGTYAHEDIADCRGQAIFTARAGAPAMGDSFVVVQRGPTDAAGGENLLAAYAAVKALTPGGNALAAANRAVVLIPPGRYELAPQEAAPAMTLDADFVDLVAMAPEDPAAVVVTSAGGVDMGETIQQTASDVRLAGFTIENTGSAVGPATNDAFVVNADNSASAYRHMRLVQPNATLGASGEGGRSPVRGLLGIGGTWEDCAGGPFAWVVEYDMDLSAAMTDCTAGDYGFGGDLADAVSGTFTRCAGGDYSFGGCNNAGSDCSGTFIDCVAGERSFALGREFSGSATRCRAGAKSFGGYHAGAYYGSFSGAAEDCAAEGASFGSGHASCVNSGEMVRCRVADMPAAMRLEGASLRDCELNIVATDATNADCVVLADADSRLLGCTLLVKQGGSGVPIKDDGSARNVVAAGCRMNNATNDADGLGANVTNLIAAPGNVVDDGIAL
jgi:hypothetical protein